MWEKNNNKDIYTVRWQERQNQRERQRYQEKQFLVNRILPWTRFRWNDVIWYSFDYKWEKLEMNFKNFDSLKSALSIIARIKIIYEHNFWNSSERPKFYAEDWKLKIDNNKFLWLFWDTEYLSINYSKYFLAWESPVTKEWNMEIQKLADFLNKILEIK